MSSKKNTYTRQEQELARGDFWESVRILLGIGLSLAIFAIAVYFTPGVSFWILSGIAVLALLTWMRTRESLLGAISVIAALFAIGVGILEALGM